MPSKNDSFTISWSLCFWVNKHLYKTFSDKFSRAKLTDEGLCDLMEGLKRLTSLQSLALGLSRFTTLFCKRSLINFIAVKLQMMDFAVSKMASGDSPLYTIFISILKSKKADPKFLLFNRTAMTDAGFKHLQEALFALLSLKSFFPRHTPEPG